MASGTPPVEPPQRGPARGPSGPTPIAKALNCPNCGAALTIRASSHTLSVVCVQCLSILDAKDPNLQVLQQFAERERVQPIIPLGTRGKWRGDAYEVIGFQVRSVTDEGTVYSWHEYLLFNPYKGFRYLTQYNGHWNDVKIVQAVPEVTRVGGKEALRLLGQTYVHFQTASAETVYVMGEFPWQVRVGELVAVTDYVAPPFMLSSETTEAETTWSLGEYIDGSLVWQAFSLPGSPPRATGVFANQPSPYRASVKQLWIYCAILLLVLVNVVLFFSNVGAHEQVFRDSYSFSPGVNPPSFVTPSFDLKGRTSTVEIAIHTNLYYDWAYFNFALINQDTGQAYDFGREIDYNPGDLAQSPNDRVLIPSVPAGHYFLRVEPEVTGGQYRKPLRYELTIRRDVPATMFYWIAGLLILAPPIFMSLRAAGFEKARWQEGGDIVASTMEALQEIADHSDGDS
ncbi:MAG TPA: DUF4178 domain-containing protein [Bryobacterales bacterium]|nr:DUF4178 domain-containing protein [Bryobacterales bacterium]